ncbi:hypothetical protein GGS24DRAFT_458948 [Hypoxylon argillaceum]|nr:hypothetical protein GGS24DRAFT_458948 [Hypoxylon argillaceum]
MTKVTVPNGDSIGPAYGNTSNGVGDLIGPSHNGSQVNGSSVDYGHGDGDNETGGLINPDIVPAPRGGSEYEVNGGLVGRGHNDDSNEVNGASTRPARGEEANSVAERVLHPVEETTEHFPTLKSQLACKVLTVLLVTVTSGILATIILITASALKAAGYAYHDIQWPITIEVMVATILLSPAVQNAI